jgi:hypothetical protein
MITLVTSRNGTRETELLPDLPNARRRLWPLVRDGAKIEGLRVDHRWLSRAELFDLVEEVVAAAPRPIPVSVANALMGLLPWMGRRTQRAIARHSVRLERL